MSKPLSNTVLSLSAGVASVAVALTLVGLKVWAVWSTGSLAVGASLADSVIDLLMSLLAAMAIFYAARPADDDHAFGHASAEDLSALAQAMLITASALFIGYSALHRLFDPATAEIQGQTAGSVVMVLSGVLTLALVLWQGYVAKRTGSKVVAADRLHYLSDLVPMIGALIALQASQHFGIHGLDPLIALLAAALMLRAAWGIGKDAFDALMDRRADPSVIEEIRQITAQWPGVMGYHDLKTRMSGTKLFVHLHIELDGQQSLEEAHRISAGLKRRLLSTWPEADIIIHKDVA